MNIRFPLFSRSICVVLTVAAGLASAAPSNEELLSTPPANVIGSFTGNPDYNFTPWQMRAFSAEENRRKVVFKAEVSLNGLPQEAKGILINGDYFVQTPGNNYRPTPTLIDFTKPADLVGGFWTFGYESFDATLGAGGAYHVISWTWTESEPVIPSVIGVETDSSVASSLTLNRAIIRKLRGKTPRKALPLLTRQQNLLKSMLASTQ